MKLKITDIKTNPDNPRLIKDDKYQKLVQSLKDFPEMAEVREIVVNKDHVILGGNMRFRAMQEAGWTEVPVKVVDWSEAKQKEFVIKDNSSFGEWDWDLITSQYELEELDAWGVDVPVYDEPPIGLPDGDDPEYTQMTFTLHNKQAELVKKAMDDIASFDGSTFGNENGNGNKLYWIVEQWLALKK